MRYPLNQPIYLSTTLTNRAGVLTDDSTLSLTVQNPDLTTQVFASPTHDSLGTYHQDIPAADLTQLGHYIYVWSSTGLASGVSRGEFDVYNPFEPVILSLEDAKSACNIPQTNTAYDSELQAYVDTLEGALEAITGGPVYNQTIVERVNVTHNYSALAVRQRPLVSVTQIIDIASGSVVPMTDIELDLNAGIIRRKRGLMFWYWITSQYQVTYVAGWGTVIPPQFNVAARLIIQHLWQTQRGPGLAPVPGMGETFLPGFTYAIPQVALEVMRPYANEAYF